MNIVKVVRGNDLYFPQGNEDGNHYEPLFIVSTDNGKRRHTPTPHDYTRGYQDAVHGAINIHAYDTSKEYQKGFDAGCLDVRECEALYGEPEW